jgi:hypothetical protein
MTSVIPCTFGRREVSQNSRELCEISDSFTGVRTDLRLLEYDAMLIGK